MSLNGNTLTDVKCGSTPLVKGTDYTVSDDTVTIKTSFLDTLSVDTTRQTAGCKAYTLTFDFSGGATTSTASVIIGVADTTQVPELVYIDPNGNTYYASGGYISDHWNNVIYEKPAKSGTQHGRYMFRANERKPCSKGKRIP